MRAQAKVSAINPRRASWYPLVAASLLLAGALAPGPAAAQEEKSRFLDDALRALENAKRRQLLEDSSQVIDERDQLLKNVRERAAAAARKRPDLPRIDEDSLNSRAKIEALVKRASPEARRLIASGRKTGENPPGRATGDGVAGVQPTPAGAEAVEPESPGQVPGALPVDIPNIGGVPVPQPDEGADTVIERKARSDAGKMRIVCQGASFYDKSGNVMLFENQVEARHPGFLIQCEEMEVFLETGAIAPEGQESRNPAVNRDSAGIRRAVAKGMGRQVDLVRYTPKGELVGKCGLVIFDGRTGDIELRDWPEVSNGKFTRRAATKESVIIIRQNGEHKTTGKFLDDFDKTGSESTN